MEDGVENQDDELIRKRNLRSLGNQDDELIRKRNLRSLENQDDKILLSSFSNSSPVLINAPPSVILTGGSNL